MCEIFDLDLNFDSDSDDSEYIDDGENPHIMLSNFKRNIKNVVDKLSKFGKEEFKSYSHNDKIHYINDIMKSLISIGYYVNSDSGVLTGVNRPRRIVHQLLSEEVLENGNNVTFDINGINYFN
jgi:hypothetical protein